MALDLYSGGIPIGSIVRSRAGAVYAYCPAGSAVGCYADIDAAAAALAGRLKVAT